MRVVAQCAVLLMGSLPFLFMWRPWTTFGLYLMLYLPGLAAIVWYVIFTLPRELVDRHASLVTNGGHRDPPSSARGLGL